MTPLAMGSDLSRLPATVAGLSAAITSTHQAVVGCGCQGGAGNETLGLIADHVRAAAETLESVARVDPATGPDDTGRPTLAPPAAGQDLAQMCADCITLAVEVLGNEEQELTPFDVLAVTRCVTALSSARICAQDLAA